MNDIVRAGRSCRCSHTRDIRSKALACEVRSSPRPNTNSNLPEANNGGIHEAYPNTRRTADRKNRERRGDWKEETCGGY